MPGFLFDSNLWVALTFAAHPYHDRAGEQIKQSSADKSIYRIRTTELSAFRLITTPAIHRAFGVPNFSNHEAIAFLTSLFHESKSVEIEEPKGTRELWLQMADAENASPKIWMDAYLAAVSIKGEHEFVSLDHDFRRFEPDGLMLTVIE